METVGEREESLLHTITALEVPLLTAAQQEFGNERGWRICGGVNIALCWLVQHYTGIPFRKGGLDEHIEICLDIYEGQPLDHAYIKYYTGSHEILYIDSIAPLLWGNYQQKWNRLRGATDIACFTLGNIKTRLAEQYNLHQFRNERADQIPLNILYGDKRPNGPHDYSDQLAALHSPQALTDWVDLPSGRSINVSSYWSERICRMMRATVQACPELGPCTVPDDMFAQHERHAAELAARQFDTSLTSTFRY